jgi:hypothetical protein
MSRVLCLSHETDPPGQQLLHHPLLEQARLFSTGFEGGDLGVHVGEYGSNGILFICRWI